MQVRFDLETAEDVLEPEIKKIASYEGKPPVETAFPDWARS